MSESAILKRIMLACSRGAVRMFRNNCGALQDKNGQWVRYGVANPGGSDLIGWRTVTVTPEMVGARLAVFVAVEVKDKGRATDAQLSFIQAVRTAGGIAGVARSEEAALAILQTMPGDTVHTE